MLLRIFVDNINYFNHGIYHKILYLIRSALWHRGGYVNRGRKNIFRTPASSFLSALHNFAKSGARYSQEDSMKKGLMGGAWRGVLFSGASLYPECAGVVVQQSGVFLLHWYVLRRVHHRRGAFQPDHCQAEKVRRGKQGRREIREHQGPHPGFQPECRCQVSLFLPLPFGQPSGRAPEGNVSQAGKAERQPEMILLAERR